MEAKDRARATATKAGELERAGANHAFTFAPCCHLYILSTVNTILSSFQSLHTSASIVVLGSGNRLRHCRQSSSAIWLGEETRRKQVHQRSVVNLNRQLTTSRSLLLYYRALLNYTATVRRDRPLLVARSHSRTSLVLQYHH